MLTLRYLYVLTECRQEKCSGDPQTLDKFIELEKDSQSEGSGQQLTKTASMADITFINDSTNLAVLENNIDELLKKISSNV